MKFRLKKPTITGGIFDIFSSSEETIKQPKEDNYNMSGLVLRVYTSKKNPFVGKQLPRVGACIKKITVENNPNWYVFQLREPMPYSNYHPSLFVIKPYNSAHSLDMDKVPIYFMMIPNEKLLKLANIPIRELRTVGKVFSRPINI